MPTRDEDWWRLIEGDEPGDLIAAILRRGQDSWHILEALADMNSAKEAHDAIAQADGETIRRALMAAIVSRVGTPLSPEARVQWMRHGATAAETLAMFDFARPDEL